MGEGKNLHLRISLSIHLRSSQIRIIYMSTPKWKRYKPNRQPTHHKCDGMNHNLFISAFFSLLLLLFCDICCKALVEQQSSSCDDVFCYSRQQLDLFISYFAISAHFQPAAEQQRSALMAEWSSRYRNQSNNAFKVSTGWREAAQAHPVSVSLSQVTELSDESVAQSIIMANNWNWYRYRGGGGGGGVRGDRDQEHNTGEWQFK